MTSFINAAPTIQSIIGVYVIIIFWFSTIIIAFEVKNKHCKSLIYVVPIFIGLYIAAQCIFYNIHYEFVPANRSKMLIDSWGSLPLVLVITALVMVTILELKVFEDNRKWVREHITATSIKEAIDNLPVGICCYEYNGHVVLKNYSMERICRAYTGEPLLNAVTFINEIMKGSKQTEKGTILQLENGEVFTFTDRAIGDKESNLRMLSLVDITEQYKNTKTLEEKQQLVAKLNDELVLYGKRIVDSITAREILDAKVKIHDELGVNLLMSKHYILSGGTKEDRENIERALCRNLKYLKKEKEKISIDEFSVIFETAKKLDLKMKLIGNLTELEPQRHIIVTGIHECLTNTIRHAGGDELYIKIDESDTEFRVEITNNGKKPEGEITERGGLLLLRTLVENNDGIMEISWTPCFALRLKLKK